MAAGGAGEACRDEGMAATGADERKAAAAGTVTDEGYAARAASADLANTSAAEAEPGGDASTDASRSDSPATCSL